ncbi:MAG: hypothetical protein GY785_06205 [Gammaproteobacteria bacterium]|nr:hypothetical protein [Gammaproteobacteria bacterium]
MIISSGETFTSPALEIRNGNVLISDKPDWGVEIEPEWIALSDYRVSYTGSRF